MDDLVAGQIVVGCQKLWRTSQQYRLTFSTTLSILLAQFLPLNSCRKLSGTYVLRMVHHMAETVTMKRIAHLTELRAACKRSLMMFQTDFGQSK